MWSRDQSSPVRGPSRSTLTPLTRARAFFRDREGNSVRREGWLCISCSRSDRNGRSAGSSEVVEDSARLKTKTPSLGLNWKITRLLPPRRFRVFRTAAGTVI